MKKVKGYRPYLTYIFKEKNSRREPQKVNYLFKSSRYQESHVTKEEAERELNEAILEIQKLYPVLEQGIEEVEIERKMVFEGEAKHALEWYYDEFEFDTFCIGDKNIEADIASKLHGRKVRVTFEILDDEDS